MTVVDPLRNSTPTVAPDGTVPWSRSMAAVMPADAEALHVAEALDEVAAPIVHEGFPTSLFATPVEVVPLVAMVQPSAAGDEPVCASAARRIARLRGKGVPMKKSEAFESVSVAPCAFRMAAVVLLSAPVAEPSGQLPVP